MLSFKVLSMNGKNGISDGQGRSDDLDCGHRAASSGAYAQNFPWYERAGA
jgi:hypothetical protein